MTSPAALKAAVVTQIEGRDIPGATRRVSDMTNDEIALFAKHDPDIFRHVARAAIANMPRRWMDDAAVVALLQRAKNATHNSRNITYPSRTAAQHMRDLVDELAAAIMESSR